jgi:hypothetical protein
MFPGADMESVLVDVVRPDGGVTAEAVIASLVREPGGAWQGEVLLEAATAPRRGNTYRIFSLDGRNGEAVVDAVDWEAGGLLRVRLRGLGRFRRPARTGAFAPVACS